jgi:hypothetical protein
VSASDPILLQEAGARRSRVSGNAIEEGRTQMQPRDDPAGRGESAARATGGKGQGAAPKGAGKPPERISAARAAARDFLASELDAREVRVTRISPTGEGGGWSVEAEILVPNLDVKMLGLPLTQEVLEREHYVVELAADLVVTSYRHVGADEE